MYGVETRREMERENKQQSQPGHSKGKADIEENEAEDKGFGVVFVAS
jgi:hypothetical protein